jgi:hypothetical protein
MRRKEKKGGGKTRLSLLACFSRSSQVFVLFSSRSLSKTLALSFPPFHSNICNHSHRINHLVEESRRIGARECFRKRVFFPSICFDLDRSIGWWPINDDDDDAEKQENARTVFPSSAQSTRHLSPLAARDRRL